MKLNIKRTDYKKTSIHYVRSLRYFWMQRRYWLVTIKFRQGKYCACQYPIIRGYEPKIYCLTCTKPIKK